MKTKVYYCSKCGEKTAHEFVDKKTVGDGTGICRGLLAVMSLGMSETVGADYYYQCRRCGKLKKTS